MSIYSIAGAALSVAFSVYGSALKAAYDMNGRVLWAAEPFRNSFSGVHQPFSGWRFRLVSPAADMNYTGTTEAAADFDDSTWEKVTVPHDWSIARSFNPESPATDAGGYLDGGDAWYRCSMDVTDDMVTKKTVLFFEGVYMDCTVYLNGEKLGEHHYGYAPFALDVSATLKKGRNTLAVFVRNRQPNCRWYSGSGIFRPCYLLALEDKGVVIRELRVTTPKLEQEQGGAVTTQLDCIVQSDAAATATITAEIGYQGAKIAESEKPVQLTAGENAVSIAVPVPAPQLWDVYNGSLHDACIRVKTASGTVSSYPVRFGYRWTKWDVDTGFWLNGKNIKLKGVCMHHDLGCIGAQANRSAMERQLDSMIAMGANAIRLTHNPGSTAFLTLCAEKGVLCVEELFDGWSHAKKQYDFAGHFLAEYDGVIEAVIKRDWNNPAVILWSLGNEISTNLNGGDYTADEATALCRALIDSVKKRDTTRPVTMGENSPYSGRGKACMQLLDVCGLNYQGNDLSPMYKLGKPVYGSETTSALASRGVYARDDTGLQCSSYDDDKVSWGSYAADALRAHMTNASSGGMFVWTGWDYIGEPTPFNRYPAKSSYFGIVDLAGFPKDIYYMYQSRWTEKPMVHICPMDWDNWAAGSTVKVWLYSNCESVELFQDGVSLGRKKQSRIGSKYQFEYGVTFKKGTLTAKGYDANGKAAATDEIRSSTGTPAKLALRSARPEVEVHTDDLVFITCEVQDANGVRVPGAADTVTFACTGGTVLGTDNGNAACVQPLRGSVHDAFHGLCLCVCRHDGKTGSLTVTAAADGLAAGTVTVKKV